MKTKLIIISIAAVAVISIGATKLVNGERSEQVTVSVNRPTNSPIGGIMVDDK